jgi:glycosyltransferase involved in cell wall biosynthesis
MKDKLIGIDCTALKANYKGGINSFVSGLMEAINSSNRHSKFIIITNSNNFLFFKKFKKIRLEKINKINLFIKFSFILLGIFKLKKIFLLINKIIYKNFNKKFNHELSALYTPTSIINNFFFKNKQILSPHDLQHIYFPNNFNILRRKYREFSFKLSINKADYIQASSNFIKNNILESYPKITKKKIIKINESVNLQFFYPVNNQNKSKIVFFPAYYWPHKNHKFIISCFKKIIYDFNIDCKLIMCGGNFNNKARILNELDKSNSKKIIHLGLIDEKKLRHLYQTSTLVLSTASYESSSLPILESAACGTAILASNIHPNIELKKNLEVNLYELNNEKSFISSFLKIWNDQSLRRRNIKINLKRIKNYNWLNFVDEIINVCK